MQDQIKKPTILSFSHYGQLYGANRSLLTLIIALKHKVNWWIICKEESEFTEELARLGIEYQIVRFTNDVYHTPKRYQLFHSIKRFCYNLVMACYISILAKKKRVDVIHSNSSVIFIGAMVSMLSFRKHIWHIREFVYEDYNLRYLLGKSSFKFWAKKAGTIVCISNAIREKRIDAANIKSKCEIIYNGLADKKQIAQIPAKANAIPVIGIVGIIDPAKNQLTAIKAVAQLVKAGKPVILRIIGNVNSEPYFKELTDYVSEAKISDYVDFAGFTKDIASIFPQLDISLMCAKNEAFGRVTVESMLYGVPVIAYGSAGSTEIIEHGRTGLLYNGDATELASQIMRLLSDPGLYADIARNASEHANEKFTIQKYADKFFEVVLKNLPQF